MILSESLRVRLWADGFGGVDSQASQTHGSVHTTRDGSLFASGVGGDIFGFLSASGEGGDTFGSLSVVEVGEDALGSLSASGEDGGLFAFGELWLRKGRAVVHQVVAHKDVAHKIVDCCYADCRSVACGGGNWIEVEDAVGVLRLRGRCGGDIISDVDIRGTLVLMSGNRGGLYRRVGVTEIGTVVADLWGAYHLLTEDGSLTRLLRPLVRDTGLRRSGFARVRDFLA